MAGRRFGKTEVALIELFRAVCAKNRVAWYVAPTYRQGKRIAWQRLKNLVRPFRPSRISETDLKIDFPWGATLRFAGPTTMTCCAARGWILWCWTNSHRCRRRAWTEVLRPMLSDRQGSALFIGTPQGGTISTSCSILLNASPIGRRFSLRPKKAEM